MYTGGSIETILSLSNGHIAVSGSYSNNKLVICDLKKELETIQELTDHNSTITGLIELDSKLISCGIDKNILVYEIKSS